MRYRFGDYCLDTQCYELHRGHVPIPLPPKVYQVLAYLLTHADRVVLRQELLEHVWPGQFVGDAALNSYIMVIRKALGDDWSGQRLLRTVRGRGYRFVAPVEVQDLAPAVPPSRLVHAPMGETAASTAPPPVFPAELLPAADPTGPATPYADGEPKLVTILCGSAGRGARPGDAAGPGGVVSPAPDGGGTGPGGAPATMRAPSPCVPSEGFTAVFGMPVAQEDHARRAVLAALELRQRLHRRPRPARTAGAGGVLALSMGLHSGLVVVGGLGTGAAGLATAVGAPLHVATRLQQQAAPGTILLSAATYPLVHAEVRAAPYGTLSAGRAALSRVRVCRPGAPAAARGGCGARPPSPESLCGARAGTGAAPRPPGAGDGGAGSGGWGGRRARHGQDPAPGRILSPCAWGTR